MVSQRALSRTATEELLGHATDPLPVARHQADPGAAIHDVVDGQRALVGDGVLELRTGHVDPVGHRLGGRSQVAAAITLAASAP